MKYSAAALAVLASVVAGPVSAATITSLSDNFNSESPANSFVLNYTGFANWDVTTGRVDLITSGDFSTGCPGTGKCVDLDGTGSPDATSTFVTKDVFAAGYYTLSFALIGSQRGDSNTMTVSLGDLSEVFTRASSSPTEIVTRTVFLASTSALSFVHVGHDDFGLLIDDVSVAAAPPPGETPLPAALPLFAAGLAGLGLVAARKKRK